MILSSHFFFCQPLFLFPITVPCRIVFAKPEDLETWPNHLSFRFLTTVRSPSYSPMAAWILLRTSSLVTWSLYEIFNSLRSHLISKACVLFSNSAVRVHDSQAYRNMKMTRERISFTFDPRDMLLSPQIGFSFVRYEVACAILERTSGLEPSSETAAYFVAFILFLWKNLLANNIDLDQTPHYVASDLGLHCLPTTLFTGFQVRMGLQRGTCLLCTRCF